MNHRHVLALAIFGTTGAMTVWACSSSSQAPAVGGPDSSVSDAPHDGGAGDVLAADVVEGGSCVPAVPTAPPAGETTAPCDLAQQNCTDPCNPKCTFFSLEAGTSKTLDNFIACGPLAGDAGVDQPCTRPTSAVGYDTCVAGFICVSSARAVDASAPRGCRPVCKAAADCPQGEVCISLTPIGAAAQGGYCATPCDPFNPACSPMDSCQTNLDTTGRYQLTCGALAGSIAAGSACPSASYCAAGTTCVNVNDAGQTCQTFCDSTHACADGGTCAALANATYSVCN
jgi:hypothetical protein